MICIISPYWLTHHGHTMVIPWSPLVSRLSVARILQGFSGFLQLHQRLCPEVWWFTDEVQAGRYRFFLAMSSPWWSVAVWHVSWTPHLRYWQSNICISFHASIVANHILMDEPANLPIFGQPPIFPLAFRIIPVTVYSKWCSRLTNKAPTGL